MTIVLALKDDEYASKTLFSDRITCLWLIATNPVKVSAIRERATLSGR
jgi:hypothetical protein